jgi:hypothetical protein
MARHLFIAQQTLATWMDQEKISFDGHLMTIRADGRKFKLVEAVRFIKVDGGESDMNNLLGKVKTNEQLECLGAERYRDSVIFGDLAYQVQEGFIGEVFLSQIDGEPQAECSASQEPSAGPQHAGAPASVRPLAVAQTQPILPVVRSTAPSLPKSPSQPAREPVAAPSARPAAARETPPAAPGKKDEPSDEELLTRFLLDNL